MKRPCLLVLSIFAASSVFLSAQQQTPDHQGPPGPIVYLIPSFDIPLGEAASSFGFGGTARVGVHYPLPFLPAIFLSGDLGYSFEMANGVPLSVSVTSGAIGAGVRFPITPWLAASLGLSGGYFYTFLNDLSASGHNPCVSAGAALELLPGPLQVNAGAAYDYYFGLYSGIKASIGLSYELGGGSRGARPVQVQPPPSEKPQPLKSEPPQEKAPEESGQLLEFESISLEDIYPVFHTYYDTRRLGKVTLRNASGEPITRLKVTFQIKQFMADPKDCPSPTELKPGESITVDLFALFLPSILDMTEKTKTQARVDVEYVLKGETHRQNQVQSIPVLDRNATSWEDNRRAAAFVTTKDPAVLTFSKNVNSMVNGKVQGAVNPNLLTAMAFFEALQLFGLTYSQDPIPTITSSKQVADYIQFPRQTLQYKGGKCSDFSVLYCALLEAVGIETAFITTPGHIFIAFSTGLSDSEARKSFSRSDDLIFRTDKCWIPLEVTVSAGFLQAWQQGAKEWRENLSRNQADLYPLHEAWQLYEPVALPGAEVTVSLPAAEKILERYLPEATKFIDQEIYPRVAALQGKISKAQDPREPTNKLGVLYARYGQHDKAQRMFEKLLEKEEYVPALLNLGNIYSLNDQKVKALDFYNRAFAREPKNPKVLLSIAQINHELENYFAVKQAYGELKTMDPDLALQFAYLDLKGEEATRAADAAGVRGIVVWEE